MIPLARIEAALRAVPTLCECGKPEVDGDFHPGCVASGWPDYPALARAVADVERETREEDAKWIASHIGASWATEFRARAAAREENT